ncbi:MAG: DUF1858 domain-containing protein [Candidatus Diapherotrites archaeon]|nr:DUF1858 domain-containing protein [Candidatus Diapherotrites archaeon]
MIRKEDLLEEIIGKNPEVLPVLAQAGLHCIGCHLSASETLEGGCKAHGMNDSEIRGLVTKVNKEVSNFEKKPRVEFTKNAVAELERRVNENGKKYVRVVQLFGGEFDFDAVDEKDGEDIELKPGSGVVVLLGPRTEKFLREIKIDYDKGVKDFVAARAAKK